MSIWLVCRGPVLRQTWSCARILLCLLAWLICRIYYTNNTIIIYTTCDKYRCIYKLIPAVCSLDDNQMGGQVDAMCEGRCRA